MGLISLHTQAPKWRLTNFLSQNCLPDSTGQGPSLRPSTLSLKPIAISRTYLSQRRKLSAQLCQPIAAGLPRPRRLGQWGGFPARTAARCGEAGPQAGQGKAEFSVLAGRQTAWPSIRLPASLRDKSLPQGGCGGTFISKGHSWEPLGKGGFSDLVSFLCPALSLSGHFANILSGKRSSYSVN